MSALPPIATAKADIRNRSCPLCPQKRTCAVQLRMSALGQKRTFLTCADERFLLKDRIDQKSGKNTGVLQDLRQMSSYVTCGVNVRTHLEKTRNPRDRSGDHHTVCSVAVVGC